jgi:hypothetical protein
MVGTSAITNHEIGRAPNYRDNRALMGEVSRYLNSRDQRVVVWPDLFDRLVRAHKDFWAAPPAYRDAVRNRRQTSAELLSTWTLWTSPQNSFVPQRVCLISSGTDDGWFATLINQRVMEEAWGWNGVEKFQLPGLDASCFGLYQKFQQFFSESLLIPESEEVVWNITGGYKGAVPEITLIAAARRWRLYYQHEESNEAAWLEVVARDIEATTSPVREPDRPIVLR